MQKIREDISKFRLAPYRNSACDYDTIQINSTYAFRETGIFGRMEAVRQGLSVVMLREECAFRRGYEPAVRAERIESLVGRRASRSQQ